MRFADRVKQTTTSTNAAIIPLSGTVATFGTFPAAFEVGATGIVACMDDGKGAWEISVYTLTNASTLTRTAILSSSNGGAAVTFPAGTKEVFCTVSAKVLADFVSLSDGITAAQLPTGTPVDTDLLMFHRPGVGDFKITYGAWKALGTDNPPAGDTAAPTVVSAQVANATPSRIDITFSESLASSAPPASAFTVSGGKTASSVSINGAVVSVMVNSAYANGDVITVGYTKPASNPRIQDGSSNAAESFSARAVTNNIGVAATRPAAPTIGTAVAGDGYVDVAFTRNSNGGAAVIDSTATLSTGQTATGTTSPIRVTAPNGTAVTATVRDRNSVGLSDPSAASNSVTPQAAPVGAYQRASSRIGLTESGAGPYAYTGTSSGTFNTQQAACDVSLQDGVDGYLAVRMENLTGKNVIFGLQSAATYQPYTNIAIYIWQSGGKWAGAGGSGTVGATVAPATGDIVRLRRAGATVYAEVARAGDPSNFTIIHTWPTVIAQNRYFGFNMVGDAKFTPFDSAGLA